LPHHWRLPSGSPALCARRLWAGNTSGAPRRTDHGHRSAYDPASAPELTVRVVPDAAQGKPGPDYSRRPEQGRAKCCRNKAKAVRRGMPGAPVCSSAERPKFRQRLWLLAAACEVMN